MLEVITKLGTGTTAQFQLRYMPSKPKVRACLQTTTSSPQRPRTTKTDTCILESLTCSPSAVRPGSSAPSLPSSSIGAEIVTFLPSLPLFVVLFAIFGVDESVSDGKPLSEDSCPLDDWCHGASCRSLRGNVPNELAPKPFDSMTGKIDQLFMLVHSQSAQPHNKFLDPAAPGRTVCHFAPRPVRSLCVDAKKSTQTTEQQAAASNLLSFQMDSTASPAKTQCSSFIVDPTSIDWQLIYDRSQFLDANQFYCLIGPEQLNNPIQMC